MIDPSQLPVTFVDADAANDPTCDKCGAPVCTGIMAMICPHAEQCEFWPEDPDSQEFVRQWRERHVNQTGDA